MADVYDTVFRTVLNDCREFLLPLLNEVFGESLDGTETVEFRPNELFLDQQDEPDRKRITDSNFSVSRMGAVYKKYHLECESSRFCSEILIRIFEYDAQIALNDSRDVIRELTKNYKNLQERVNGAMVGPIIETEAKRILNKGIAQERATWEKKAAAWEQEKAAWTLERADFSKKEKDFSRKEKDFARKEADWENEKLRLMKEIEELKKNQIKN